MPDFRLQNNFPIAEVINAAQQNAKLQLQARTQGQQSLIEGLQSIGQVGQSLFDTRKRVAQSLALGKQFDIPDDVARTMDPEQILKVGQIKKNNLDMASLIQGVMAMQKNAPANGANAGMKAAAGTAAPAASAGPILASNVTATPMDTPSLPPGLPASTTGQMQVPISAPPSAPTSSKPSKTMNPATFSAMLKLHSAMAPQSVMSNEDALAAGSIPHGTKIIHTASDGKPKAVTYMGNTPDGKPLLLAGDGTISIGKVPGDASVLPKSSTQPTAATRTTSEFARTIIPHIDTMRDLVNQADEKCFIGPAAGRIYGYFLAGKVGTTGNQEADRLLGRLRATDSLLKTGAMKVHFGSRGGTQMYDHFSDMLNSGKQSKAVLNGALDGIQDFMQGYANPPSPSAPAPLPAASSAPAGWSSDNEQRLQMLLEKQKNGS